jgi:hypothetical protein
VHLPSTVRAIPQPHHSVHVPTAINPPPHTQQELVNPVRGVSVSRRSNPTRAAQLLLYEISVYYSGDLGNTSPRRGPPRAGTVIYNPLSLQGGINCIKPSRLEGCVVYILEALTCGAGDVERPSRTSSTTSRTFKLTLTGLPISIKSWPLRDRCRPQRAQKYPKKNQENTNLITRVCQMIYKRNRLQRATTET